MPIVFLIVLFNQKVARLSILLERRVYRKTLCCSFIQSIVTAYLSEPLSFPMEDSVLAADEGQPTLTATLKPAAGVEVPPLARQFAIQHLHSLVGG